MKRNSKPVAVALISSKGQFAGNVTLARVSPLINLEPLVSRMRHDLARTMNVEPQECVFAFAWSDSRLVVRLELPQRASEKLSAEQVKAIEEQMDREICTRLADLHQARAG